MNGKIIQVDVAYKKMIDQANMTPDEYQEFLASNPPSLEGIEDLVDQGMLPPYRPHCRGTIIKRVAEWSVKGMRPNPFFMKAIQQVDFQKAFDEGVATFLQRIK